MAGSFAQLPSNQSPASEASLVSRLEGLQLLAEHLAEPVIIFTPDRKLVYANPSAKRLTEDCPLIERVQDEGLDPCHQILEPCTSCPGKQLLEISQAAATPGFTPPRPDIPHQTCPLPRAVTIPREAGQIGYVVMMGGTGRQSVVHREEYGDQEPLASPDLTDPRPQQGPTELIGESPAMHRLVEMIRLVAASEATVLIQGESGTGKELVAKTIHRLSQRCDKPFVVVECSALPETLLESELFGHVRGAFTGATTDRKGLFEEAEGGTIFLDEICDTNPIFQAKLLRVLQEGEIKPVGSSRSIKVDVRVISACNRSLADLVEKRAFRLDLYYRLAVLPLTIPPLRDRREDIPLLVEHFLSQALHRHGKSTLTLEADAIEALSQHTWPGNVRELENLIERVVVTARHPRVSIHQLFPTPLTSPHPADLAAAGKAAREEVEKARILEALRQSNGEKVRAARILNISRASLYNKLKAYRIVC